MNILITGATGFIGKSLIKDLKNEHFITALLQYESDKSLLPNGVKSIIYDKNNVRDIRQCIINEKINGIIHLASLFLKDHKSEQVPKLIESNILLGTQILEIAANNNVKWFINTGTFWQHYKNEKYNPVNLYAATKQAFEDIARYYIETSNLKFVTIKLNDTFGPGDTRPKIFNLWNKIANSDKPLDMSPGEQLIDISYIDNVIAAFERLIEIFQINEIDINGKNFALYSDNQMTLKKLANLFEKTIGKKLNINWGAKQYRDREVMKPWENGTTIPGLRILTSIEDGLKKIHQSYLKKEDKQKK